MAEYQLTGPVDLIPRQNHIRQLGPQGAKRRTGSGSFAILFANRRASSRPSFAERGRPINQTSLSILVII